MSSEDLEERDLGTPLDPGESPHARPHTHRPSDTYESTVGHHRLHRVPHLIPADFLDSLTEGHQARTRVPSRAALTHRLRKLRSKMVKCRQCENYIMVNGLECEEVRPRRR